MKNPVQAEAPRRLCLAAETAADLMAPNPVSLRADATVREASAFLSSKGFSAAPVINAAGRPVGVLSLADLVVHGQEAALPATGRGDGPPEGRGAGRPRVHDLMTPTVFSVTPDAPAGTVVEEMLGLKVHRLFVVDKGGVLIGVISALDVLRHLRADPPPAPASRERASPGKCW
jgi:CBS domain-containing protein